MLQTKTVKHCIFYQLSYNPLEVPFLDKHEELQFCSYGCVSRLRTLTSYCSFAPKQLALTSSNRLNSASLYITAHVIRPTSLFTWFILDLETLSRVLGRKYDTIVGLNI